MTQALRFFVVGLTAAALTALSGGG